MIGKDYDPFDPNDKNIVRLCDWLAKRHHGVPKSTVDAFWYLVALNKPDQLTAWLEDRMEWAPQLKKLLECRIQDQEERGHDRG